MKIVTDELSDEEMGFYAGWSSMHLEAMLVQVPGKQNRKEFTKDFFRCLRPELVKYLIEHKTVLFHQSNWNYIALPKEAKDG